MDITHTHDFSAPVAEVAAMLVNDEFARARGQASGATSADVVVTGSVDDGATVSIRQAVPASSIPSEFRSFVGSDLTVRYTEVWEPPAGEERHGTFAVEIAGSPGHAAGRLVLAPSGEGSTLTAEGTVTVRIPIFGPMIEQAIGGAVVKALTAELDAADAWLARG